MSEGKDKESDYSYSQLINAVSELTRENLKLRDALVYYEAQFELFMKSQEQSKKEGK